MTDAKEIIIEELPENPFRIAAFISKEMRGLGVSDEAVGEFISETDCGSVESVLDSARRWVGVTVAGEPERERTGVSSLDGTVIREDFHDLI